MNTKCKGRFRILMLSLFLSFSSLEKDISTLRKECQAGNINSCKKLYEIAYADNDEKLRISARDALAFIIDKGCDWGVMMRAVAKITDEKLLIEIAKSKEYEGVRKEAAKKINDQEFLEKFAILEEDLSVREAAIENLNNIGLKNKLKSEVLRFNEINKIMDSDPLLNSITKRIESYWEARICFIRIKAATQERIYKLRLPGLQCFGYATETGASYFGYPYGGYMTGEKITIKLTQGEKTLAEKSWSTDFPKKSSSLGFISANVNGVDLFKELMQLSVFIQEDFAQLCHSSIPEVRTAALFQLSDQNLLFEIVKTARDFKVREIATQKLTENRLLSEIVKTSNSKSILLQAALSNPNLTDQGILAEFAKTADYEYARASAVANPNLSDQKLLVMIAKTDKVGLVRNCATHKISDQSVLATIAKFDKDENVRVTAIRKLTDHKLLGKIAKNDKDSFVRSVASDRLIEIGNN